MFELVSKYTPNGDQPEAIKKLVDGITDLNFMTIENLSEPMEVTAKIRYAAKPVKATIVPVEKDKVKVVFEEKQRAITPGQAVVFYNDGIVVGGGTIL